MGTFDPKKLALPQKPVSKVQGTKPPRFTPKGHFLKGPVPLDWVTEASKLPGRTLQVGMALWYRAGLERSRTVRLSTVLTKRFGVDRHAKSRALRELTLAGLVAVEAHPGRAPLVTILETRETP